MQLDGASSLPHNVLKRAEDTVDKLSKLWDEIGVAAVDREAETRNLFADIETLLDAKVDELLQSKAQLALKIRLTKVKLKNLCVQLGKHCPIPEDELQGSNSCGHRATADTPSAARKSCGGSDSILGTFGSIDLTLKQQFDKLESATNEMEEQRDARHAALSQKASQLKALLIEQHGTLTPELEETASLGVDDDLTPASERRLDVSLAEAKAAQQSRIASIGQFVAEMQGLWQELGTDEAEGLWAEMDSKVRSGGSTLQPSAAVLSGLRQRCDILQQIHANRIQKREEQDQKLQKLWDRLEIPTDQREAHTQQNLGIRKETLQSNQLKIEELETLQSTMLPKLIENARLKLLALHQESMQPCTATFDDVASSLQELERIDAMIDQQQQQLESRLPLLKQIEKWNALLREAAELKSAGTDPSRLLDRGAGGFRARQQEEKRRNMVTKELPKLTEKLRKMVSEWEDSAGCSFFINGESFIDIMDKEKERGEKEKEEEKQRREMQKSSRAPASVVATSLSSHNIGAAPKASPMRNGTPRRDGKFGTVPQRSPAVRNVVKSAILPKEQEKRRLFQTDKENQGQQVVRSATGVIEGAVQDPLAEISQLPSTETPDDSVSIVDVSVNVNDVSVNVNDVSANIQVEDETEKTADVSQSFDDKIIHDTDQKEEAAMQGEPADAETSTDSENRKRKLSHTTGSGAKGRKTTMVQMDAVQEEESSSFSNSSGVSSGTVDQVAVAVQSSPALAKMDPAKVAEALKNWDYLADNYYTEEERNEIGRELLKEMEERQEELKAPSKCNIRFKKGEVLGAGSFGQVYRGLNEGTGELLAIKEVDCSKAGEAAISSLESEIEMLQKLRHPNIVAYYGVIRDEGISVLVEYCAGGSIASVIGSFGALNEQVARAYTRQILLGLDYLHKHCIVHRDVKCANVLLDADGNVKVADFGASKQLSSINGEAAALSMQGTPFFMAPEVIKQTNIGRQSDLWSVGCCVVEMCTSRPPFANQFSNVAALLWHIARSVDPPELPDHLSQECHDFCAQCFRRNPEDRPSARRLLRHPFVASWNVEASKQKQTAQSGQDDSRLSVAANRRISALF